MASKLGKGQELTRKQIVRLASAISADNMASIAEGYMDIDDATIKNLQYENKCNAEAFNREIIKRWKNQNPGNQVEVNIMDLTTVIKISKLNSKKMPLFFQNFTVFNILLEFY